jgi:rSAM/selenodomain-associated transferase 2
VKISIIIPVINEEKNLSTTLQYLQLFRSQGHEIIVVDGGSVDNSLSIAQDNADAVIVSQLGRATQMNNGASVATGDVFLFLHADTFLPVEAEALITEETGDSFWGYFDVRLSGRNRVFRLIEWLINHRSRLSSIATGDQAIFVSRKLFFDVGRFPEIKLMEDVAISRLLKCIVTPVCLKAPVLTSSRRWEDKGITSTVLLMWRLRLLYFFGASPDKLSRMYR